MIGLGASVNLAIVSRVGLQGLGYVLAELAVTFVLALWLAHRRRIGSKIAALITAGTGTLAALRTGWIH